MAQEPDKQPRKGKPHKSDAKAGVSPSEGVLHEHERIDALMPWIDCDDLSEEDRALVSQERVTSLAFGAKEAQDRDLAAALDDIAADERAESEGDADAAWSAFKARLADATPTSAPSPSVDDLPPLRERTKRSSRSSAWRRFRMPQTSVGWLATAQTAVLAALAFMFVPGQIASDEPEYRTLSAGEAPTTVPAGNAVLVFDPASDQTAMQTALNQAGARIVDGPMANGGYVIALDPEALETGLEALKANDAVILAETLKPRDEP